MKFCYNTNSTLPKQFQSSRSVLQDGSRTFGLFWKEKTPSYNRRNTVQWTLYKTTAFVPKTFDLKLNLLLSRIHILNNKAIPCKSKCRDKESCSCNECCYKEG